MQRIWAGTCGISLWYLFGGVGRLSEDGLPVRPYEHDERNVEEGQVDNWRETASKVSGYPEHKQGALWDGATQDLA